LHFNTKLTFYKFAKQYTIYNQSLKAIKERESHVQKPRNINKTNTPIITALAITTTLPTMTLTTINLNPYPYTNAFIKLIYQNPLH